MQFDIRRFEETASTNDDAKAAAEAGAAEGLVIWALQQSAGRGRQGRQWLSPEGNLYFSLLLRPPVPMREFGCYSFVAALALHEVVGFYVNGDASLSRTAGEGMVDEKNSSEILKATTPSPVSCKSTSHPLPPCGRGAISVQLKWPNDVLVGGKKISGILLEAGKGYLIAGMGLNVRHVPENPLYPVTSLAAENADVPALEDILTRILTAFDVWYQRLNTEGFAPIRAVWLSHARKGAMRVRQPSGEIQGEFADLDAEGNLRLLLPDGTEKSINTGDVFF